MDDKDEQVEGEKISSKEIQDEQGWKTIHARNKKNREPDEDINPDRQVDAKSADEVAYQRRALRNIKKMNTTPKKPHLPKEDIKIIIRPRDGFNTARYSVAQIGDCILRATWLKPEEVVKDSIRLNERQNIIVVSAPTLESAEKYSALKELRIGDKTYEVTAYMTAPEDTSKGIIRGIPDYDTPEDVERSLVNERNPGILHVALTSRSLCSGGRTFKTPYLVKKRQWERKLQDEETLRERQRSENANRDADGAGIKKDDFPALDDGRQHRSRSRSRSGAHSRSRSREHCDGSKPRASSEPRTRRRAASRPGNRPLETKEAEAESGHPRPLQVTWADAVSGGRWRIEAAPPNATTEANKELAQIKQMLLQLSKDNAKLREDINVLKEENARLRNGVKDSKEVAQIAKDTEEIFEETDDESTLIDDCDIADMTDEDDEGFKVVRHRKERTVGIAAIITPVTEGADLQKVNHIALSTNIEEILGASPVSSRFSAQGALLLDVLTEEHVDALLSCKSISGTAISASVPNSYLQSTCILRRVPKWYTDEELLDNLKPQGFIMQAESCDGSKLPNPNGSPGEPTPLF
ncbi:hypothetical protein HPB49_013104 [Dermacentor silvarum]|uniref:Uncharacterized protein n=1 Tax=Dermacentor silvarum TaxID=543639 RepID=A0ACB8D5Q9_DERSI|nr:hypothetical protein HPB49_013104 [Dermacentor silvarum]